MNYVHAHASIPPNKPIGVIDSFGRGFETVITHVNLIALPLLLDLFLWLGPQLSVAPMMTEVSVLMDAQLRSANISEEMQVAVQEALLEAGDNVNVFGFLSTSPLGVPSMMVSGGSDGTPFGSALRIPVSSGGTLFALIVVLSVVGLFLGTVFWELIARRVLSMDERWSDEVILERVWFHWMRMLGLAGALLVAMMLYFFVIAMASTFLSMLHSSLGGIVSSFAIALGFWAIFCVAFTVHGVVMHDRSLVPALRNSLRLVRWNMPAVTALFVLIMFLSWGLGFLWLLPPRDSWLSLAGITAHAFVATGVWAATFHFFQDRLRWCDEMQAALVEEPRSTRSIGITESSEGNKRAENETDD